jgi:hypothetical protein
MRTLKKLAVVAVAVFALSVVGVASASAAQFTASATGELTGKATSTQKFTTGAGTVECTAAATSGKIVSEASPEQEVTVKYSGCKAFGFVSAEISPATYLFTANGEVHIQNTITISVPLGGCSVTVGPQTVKSVSFANAGTSNITESSNVSGIVSKGSGGLCGGANSTGKYVGNSEISRVGGGTLRFDA